MSKLPAVLAYVATRELAKAKALAMRVIAERLGNGEDITDMANLFLVVA